MFFKVRKGLRIVKKARKKSVASGFIMTNFEFENWFEY